GRDQRAGAVDPHRHLRAADGRLGGHGVLVGDLLPGRDRMAVDSGTPSKGEPRGTAPSDTTGREGHASMPGGGRRGPAERRGYLRLVSAAAADARAEAE